MMVAGTISKWTGYGSSPIRPAIPQISPIAFSSCGSLRPSWGHRPQAGLIPGREELLEGRVDVLLAGDRHTDEVRVADLAERRHQRRRRAPPALLDLPIAERVGARQQRLHEVEAPLVVDLAPVVAVREMEWV